MPSLKQVYATFGARVEWLELYVREAHPGEAFSAHRSDEQKMLQASVFREAEDLPWPVAVDTLDGDTHRAYGLLPNPVFLIDADGQVAFRGEFAHAPTLHRAIEHLLAQDGRGTVPEGDDRTPHMLAASAFGWDALERGGRDAVRDVVKGLPPLAAQLWLGRRLSPLLSPLATRGRPLPAGVRWTIAAAAAGAALLALRALTRRRR